MKLISTIFCMTMISFSFSMEKPLLKKVIFVVGPAGSGKTTVATAYAREHSQICAHYSVGNLLREQAKNETELGLLIRGFLERSEITPLEIGMDVVERALESETKSLILLDGFPPTIEYMDAFEDLVQHNSTIKLLGAIAFEIDQNTAEERVLGRLRSDDNRENFLKRYNRYMNNSGGLNERYSRYGLRQINGAQSLERVQSLFDKSISELIVLHLH